MRDGPRGARPGVASCPNEALRAEARSTQLPQCRAYELVSPQYTADVGVSWGFGGGAAPDGEAAQFGSTGGFAGAGSNYGIGWYIARRVENVGWKTSWVGLPATLIQGTAEGTNISFDLTRDLVREIGFNETKESLFVSDDLTAAAGFSFTKVTGYSEMPGWSVFGSSYETVGEVAGANPSFSHLVIDQGKPGESALYDLAGVGGPKPEPPPQIVSIRPGTKETLPGESGLGAGNFGSGSRFHAISNDGSEISSATAERRMSA